AGREARLARHRPGRHRPPDHRRLRPAWPRRHRDPAGDRSARWRGHADRRRPCSGTLEAMNFADRLAESVARKGSTLCVGLDPRIELLPPELVVGLKPGRAGRARAYERFCEGLIEAVADEAVAITPQVAFFEALGGYGLTALEMLCDGRPLWERTAELIAEWGSGLIGECGLSSVGAVMGATNPEAVERARELMPAQVLLLPGVGAQGGSAGELAAAFRDHPAGG